ncbi:reverse transcriptase [Plakobranchus ocellatus]|uniref:Reverse transcriptase n=1 Tax=Plakobranchus ocellatus TaxID=259542 RepID=A0AAV3YSR3_9GAST|nr:reverse transcriptase [Plakobranchus ocellatus]
MGKEGRPYMPTVPRKGLLDGCDDWVVSADLPEWERHPDVIRKTALRPDIVNHSASTQQIIMVELTVPYESRMKEAHAFKEGKYLDLTKERKKDGYEAKVKRLKKIPQIKKHGPPNLAKQVRNVSAYNLPPLPPLGDFGDSDNESDAYNIPSPSVSYHSLDSDTASFVTASEGDYINNVASPREAGATGGALESTPSTSADSPMQSTSSSPEETT